MKRAGRLPSPWKALIAVAAIACSALPAKADIFLSVSNNSGGTTLYYDLTQAGATSDSGKLSVSTTSTSLGANNLSNIGLSNNQSISAWYDISPLTVPGGPTIQSISLHADVNGGASSPGVVTNLTLTLFSSNGTIATQGQTTGPTGTDGMFSTTAAGLTGYITSSLSGVNPTGSGNFILGESSKYTSWSGGVATTSSAVSPVGEDDLTTGYGMSQKNGSAVAIGVLTSKYDLTAVNTTTQISGGTDVKFVGSATLSLPEPSGMLAAFAGLPCVGMVLGYARRLRRRPAAEDVA